MRAAPPPGPGEHSALLEPITVGGWKLPNRIVMAPMTRSRAGTGDAATALNAEYYAQRASAGLIIAEASPVSPEGQGYLRTPGIHSRPQIDGWRLVTDAVHARGGRIVLQLWHVGRVSHPDNRLPGTRSVAPSAQAAGVRVFTRHGLSPAPVPHALAASEIPGIVNDFGRAAENALEAGFDGVEIHAANGYLIDQFLHDSSNRRVDAFGGAAVNRSRLLFDICDRVAQAVGAECVGVRLSPFGQFNDVADSAPADLFATVIDGLSRRGLAYLHVINHEVSGDRSQVTASVNVAAFARKLYRGPLISAGGYTARSGAALLRSGGADLIAFGRPFISNPDLVERVRDGIAMADSDRGTYYTEGASGYIDYPIAGATELPVR